MKFAQQNKKSILITRPEPEASKMRAKLQALGYEPLICPLTERYGVPASLSHNNFEGVIATSAAAFYYLSEEIALALRALPLYCVGKKTLLAAQKRGFLQKGMAFPNVASLSKYSETLPAQHFVYLAGCVRRSFLERSLAQTPHQLEVLEIYGTRALKSDFLHLAHKKIDAVLISSVFSAILLAELCAFLHKETKIYCFSERIAAQLPASMRKQAVVAEESNEEGLLKLL